MALNLENQLRAWQLKDTIFANSNGIPPATTLSRDAFRVLKDYMAQIRGNRDLQVVLFDSALHGGLDAAHRLYAVWARKSSTALDSYLVGYDMLAAGGGGDGSGPPLGDAGRFAILAGTPNITNTGSTVVIGDIGIHPAASVTGFPPGIVVDGEIHLADTTAFDGKAALVVVYDALAAWPGGVNKGVDTLGVTGTDPTLSPGVYDYTTSAHVVGDLTLDGGSDPDALFIIRAGTSLIVDNGFEIILTNGTQAKNVFWLVGSSATLGTTVIFNGNIVALTSITANTGATVAGRLLARNGTVTLDSNGGTWITGAGGSGLPASADGRFSLCFLEGQKEAFAMWPNGIPMAVGLTLKTYTTFDGLIDSELVDEPYGFVIVGAALP